MPWAMWAVHFRGAVEVDVDEGGFMKMSEDGLDVGGMASSASWRWIRRGCWRSREGGRRVGGRHDREKSVGQLDVVTVSQ
jgi:hypothetical protein